VLAGLLALLISSEVFPGKLQLAGVPDPSRTIDWVTQVRRSLPPEHGLLILPIAPTSGAAAFEDTVRWMIRCTVSGIPLANGYSGFFPAAHYDLQTRLRRPWSAALSRQLRQQRIALVFAAESGTAERLSDIPDSGLEPIWRSSRTGAVLFQINPR
jgi:hypothetical protein